MPIDQYPSTFDHLVATELPTLLSQLKISKQNPVPMADFALEGVGVKALVRRLGLTADFSGCCLLLDGTRPCYVGISKGVIKRLRQHVRGATHLDASLAYRIATQRMPHQHTRSRAMEQEEFKTHFDASKDYIRQLSVAYVRVNNPLVL